MQGAHRCAHLATYASFPGFPTAVPLARQSPAEPRPATSSLLPSGEVTRQPGQRPAGSAAAGRAHANLPAKFSDLLQFLIRAKRPAAAETPPSPLVCQPAAERPARGHHPPRGPPGTASGTHRTARSRPRPLPARPTGDRPRMAEASPAGPAASFHRLTRPTGPALDRAGTDRDPPGRDRPLPYPPSAPPRLSPGPSASMAAAASLRSPPAPLTAPGPVAGPAAAA